MKITVFFKDVESTDAIQEYIEKKLKKLEKHFEGESVDVNVTIRTQKLDQIAEIQIRSNGEFFRAETSHVDLYASIDKDVDILERQVRKMKDRKDSIIKDTLIKEKEHEVEEDILENEILKTMYYDPRPMGPEDAKMKLQENKKDIFYTFINIDTGKVNVIFKLKDNRNYGIVEPG